MKKSPSEMTNAELRQYLSEHRNEEARLLSKKCDAEGTA